MKTYKINWLRKAIILKGLLMLTVPALLVLLIGCDASSDKSAVMPAIGVGGSMARFAISENTLYIVSNKDLHVFDITNGSVPVKKTVKNMDFGIETIFPYQNHLFIGANNGLYIYDNSNPLNPVLLTRYNHVLSCDPVVVQGDYAYVTLRGGSTCRSWNGPSSLDIIDIKNPSAPVLKSSFNLKEPYGLGVVGKKLFVCEGDNGLTLLNIAKPDSVYVLKRFTDIAAYDVIPIGNRLIVTGKQGLYQYLLGQDENMELLSKITIQ